MKNIRLRKGRYQDVFADVVEVDALICDPPYSEQTHRGSLYMNGERAKEDVKRHWLKDSYDFFTETDIREFVEYWDARTNGWFCIFTDHILAPIWSKHLDYVNRYVFSPLAVVLPGSRVRLAGDGPSQWAVWLIVARPRTQTFSKWGTLPGAYVCRKYDRNGLPGGKPLSLMRDVVRDYSRPGDLVCDPCAGMGTTLLAAAMEGRRAVGSEMVAKTYRNAKKRLGIGKFKRKAGLFT